jgi:hypothetical protein
VADEARRGMVPPRAGMLSLLVAALALGLIAAVAGVGLALLLVLAALDLGVPAAVAHRLMAHRLIGLIEAALSVLAALLVVVDALVGLGALAGGAAGLALVLGLVGAADALRVKLLLALLALLFL